MGSDTGKKRFYLSLVLLIILLTINCGTFIYTSCMNNKIDANIESAKGQGIFNVIPDDNRIQLSNDEKQIFEDLQKLINNLRSFISKIMIAVIVGLTTSLPMLAVKKISKYFYNDCMNNRDSEWIDKAIIVFFSISMIFLILNINNAKSSIESIKEIERYIENTYDIISRLGIQWMQ